MRDQGWVHLTVAIHLYDDAGAVFHGRSIPSHYCPSYATINSVAQYLHARIPALSLDQIAGAVRTRVVNYIDVQHLRSNARNDVEHVFRNAKAGNHDGNGVGFGIHSLASIRWLLLCASESGRLIMRSCWYSPTASLLLFRRMLFGGCWIQAHANGGAAACPWVTRGGSRPLRRRAGMAVVTSSRSRAAFESFSIRT